LEVSHEQLEFDPDTDRRHLRGESAQWTPGKSCKNSGKVKAEAPAGFGQEKSFPR
jgi:hypothetical protein